MRRASGSGRGWCAAIAIASQLGWSAPAGALTAPAPSSGGTAPPAAAAPAPGPRAMPAAQGKLLVCESDGSYRRCPADTSAGVVLVRELSAGRCVERSTWGFDSGAIWVDRGCRAEFRIAAVPAGVPSGPARDERESRGEEPSGGGGGIDTGTALLVLGALVAGGAAAALLSGDEKEKAGKREGIRACERRLDRLVRDRGGRGAKITEIERARVRDRVLEIDARARAEWRRGSRRGFVECRVDLRGRPEVRRLRQEGLW